MSSMCKELMSTHPLFNVLLDYGCPSKWNAPALKGVQKCHVVCVMTEGVVHVHDMFTVQF